MHVTAGFGVANPGTGKKKCRGEKAGLGREVFKLRVQCLKMRDGLLHERLKSPNPAPAE